MYIFSGDGGWRSGMGGGEIGLGGREVGWGVERRGGGQMESGKAGGWPGLFFAEVGDQGNDL